LLGEAMMYAIHDGILNEDDLFTDDETVMDILKQSKNPEILNR
jgi:hypothetical protein